MSRLFIASLAALPLVATAVPAVAQPTYGIGVQAAPAPEASRWTLGLHATSTALSLGGTWGTEGFDGLGGEIRFRPVRFLELGVEGDLTSRSAWDGTTDALAMGAVTARLHPVNGSEWDPYLLVGIGGAEISALDPYGNREQAGHSMLLAGGGLERRFGNVGITGELRYVGMQNDRDYSQASRYGSVTTLDEYGPIGASATLGAAFHF